MDDLREYLLSFDPADDKAMTEPGVTWIGPFPLEVDPTPQRLGSVLLDADTGRILSFKRDDEDEGA
jgi:hypothetical protein